MTVQVIGIKKVDYYSQKYNRQVTGTELHCVREDNNVQGKAVITIYCGKQVETNHIKLNDVCDVYYNQYGKPELIQVR